MDSHFHLTSPQLAPTSIAGLKGDAYFKALAKAYDYVCGVEVGACFQDLPNVFAFAAAHKNVYCTAGVHPAYADTYVSKDLEDFIVANLDNEKFVAVGECGLDYHRADWPAREQQIKVFTAQIALAHKYGKPLVVHTRAAWDDTAAVLIANKDKLKNGVLIHCMSYTAANAQYLLAQLADVPLYFAFGGHITYKNKTFLCDALRVIPRARILIETDAPYLAPVPKMGEVNRPEYITYTAHKMAEVLNLTVKEVEALTTANALKFYQIKAASL